MHIKSISKRLAHMVVVAHAECALAGLTHKCRARRRVWKEGQVERCARRRIMAVVEVGVEDGHVPGSDVGGRRREVGKPGHA